MNDREVMEALLGGKVIVERIPGIGDEYIRMKGDELEYTVSGGGWVSDNFIPSINIKYVSVKENE